MGSSSSTAAPAAIDPLLRKTVQEHSPFQFFRTRLIVSGIGTFVCFTLAIIIHNFVIQIFALLASLIAGYCFFATIAVSAYYQWSNPEATLGEVKDNVNKITVIVGSAVVIEFIQTTAKELIKAFFKNAFKK